MLSRPLAFLYDSVPATFASDLPVERAVACLRAATAKSALLAFPHGEVVGTVAEHKVSLQRVIPFLKNSFAPFFIGRFEVEGERTLLRGTFTMHWTVKLFMSLWFGFCVVWTLWTYLALANAAVVPAKDWYFPLAGVGLLLGGASVVMLCKWFARNDKRYLSNAITEALAERAD